VTSGLLARQGDFYMRFTFSITTKLLFLTE
jgi:hypothetical protein